MSHYRIGFAPFPDRRGLRPVSKSQQDCIDKEYEAARIRNSLMQARTEELYRELESKRKAATPA